MRLAIAAALVAWVGAILFPSYATGSDAAGVMVRATSLPAHPLRGRVLKSGNARITVTRPIDPESFPDLRPHEWPTGRDVLARRGAEAVVRDVLAQAWPARMTRQLLNDQDATDGFLVWDEVARLGWFVESDTLDLRAIGADWSSWVMAGGLSPLPFIDARRPPKVSSFTMMTDALLFERTGVGRTDRILEYLARLDTDPSHVAAVIDDHAGCSAGIYVHVDDSAVGAVFGAADLGRFPDDPKRTEAFVRRCLWAMTFHGAGFAFSERFAREYGADTYPVATAAVRAINACAQSPHPTRPIMTVEQLPDPECVARKTTVYLRAD